MIVWEENLMECAKKLPELLNELTNTENLQSYYNINIQKLFVFLHTSNEQS